MVKMHGKGVVWSIKEFVQALRDRQLNQYDVNIGVSGKRGDGKSTFLYKIFERFKKDGFKQHVHQVYARDDVIRLLKAQKFGFCWDDEAIESGYKRNFQDKGQQELIKIVTKYRDNFNIYASALPFFYSLDKDLRELIFVHVHIIERGLGVLLMPLTDSIHSSDPWDTKTNMRIETIESRKILNNPKKRFPYYKFTTFAGYIYFGDMSPKARERYNRIKQKKRHDSEQDVEKEKELSFTENIFNLLMERKLSQEGLIQICLVSGKKYSNVVASVNLLMKDKGMIGKKINDYFIEIQNPYKTAQKLKSQIEELVPDF
jgi:hypothetical protein